MPVSEKANEKKVKPSSSTLTTPDIENFLREKFNREGTRMQICWICPRPADPKQYHQAVRLNFRKSVKPADALVAVDTIASSVFIKMVNNEGSLDFVSIEE